MLEVKISGQRLELQDQLLGLEIGLHESLMLLAELDEILELPTKESQQLLRLYYQHYLGSLLLLPPRERQFLLQEASLEALACLLKMLQGTASEVQLRANLSQRRLRQLEEEPIFQASRPPSSTLLKETLGGFFEQLDQRILNGELQLPDPKEPSY
ncbi:hypothetical protein SAMN05660443_1817 [Marinospirillum celere]|uniref:FliG C-terminal domain-containing protein n=1 Tax=Marinospirillum celere TaxID=1122252 RepID=A0A1I1HCJ2_9GAMM|nr:hypothetical protein [Marinospirillum celere]SFC19193.1 hypothetical protein SAMN05660443_1817 [Marinospirillum celere]